MRYQLRPADRGTPQYGEWLWNRQDLAVHFLNGRRQLALRTIETAQGEHTMRHPCKRSLIIIIRFHFNGQHQSGPDLHHVECRIRCAQLVQYDGARLGHALQGNFHNDQVYGSGSDDRRMEKNGWTPVDWGVIYRRPAVFPRVGWRQLFASNFCASGTEPSDSSLLFHSVDQPSTNALCTLSHLPVPCAYSTSAEAMSSCHC